MAQLVEADRIDGPEFAKDYDRALARLDGTTAGRPLDYTMAVSYARLHLEHKNYLAALRYVRQAEAQLPRGYSMLEAKGEALLGVARLIPSPARDTAFAQSLEAFQLLAELATPAAQADEWLAYIRSERAACLGSPPCR